MLLLLFLPIPLSASISLPQASCCCTNKNFTSFKSLFISHPSTLINTVPCKTPLSSFPVLLFLFFQRMYHHLTCHIILLCSLFIIFIIALKFELHEDDTHILSCAEGLEQCLAQKQFSKYLLTDEESVAFFSTLITNFFKNI